MLVLTRGVGDTVLIGDNIAVTVGSIRGNKVRLCVKAPENVTIMRKELYDEQRFGKGRPITVDKKE